LFVNSRRKVSPTIFDVPISLYHQLSLRMPWRRHALRAFSAA
jgi:hypothetical protein